MGSFAATGADAGWAEAVAAALAAGAAGERGAVAARAAAGGTDAAGAPAPGAGAGGGAPARAGATDAAGPLAAGTGAGAVAPAGAGAPPSPAATVLWAEERTAMAPATAPTNSTTMAPARSAWARRGWASDFTSTGRIRRRRFA